MKLSAAETVRKSWKLGILAAVMILFGYPGEIATESNTRWIFWAISMVPFLVIVYELFFGLKDAQEQQPENARSLVGKARYLVVLSWAFYPIVFILPMLGIDGGDAKTFVEVGYSIADIVAKAVFGVLIFAIAVKKSESANSSAAA